MRQTTRTTGSLIRCSGACGGGSVVTDDGPGPDDGDGNTSEFSEAFSTKPGGGPGGPMAAVADGVDTSLDTNTKELAAAIRAELIRQQVQSRLDEDEEDRRLTLGPLETIQDQPVLDFQRPEWWRKQAISWEAAS